MNLLRLSQYIQRFIHVYLTSFPGRYQAKRQEILRKMVVETNHFLSQTGVDYWLDFGTLLGFYREENIIPHDVDVDFSLMESSYEKVKASEHLLPKEFKFYDTSFRHHGPKLYLSYKGFDVDLYFYQDLGSTIRSFEKTKWKNEVQEIPKSLVFPLATAYFFEEDTHVPAKVKGYLEYLYSYIGRGGKRDLETGFWHKNEERN